MNYITAPADKASVLTKNLRNPQHKIPRVVRLTHAEAVAVIEAFVPLFGRIVLDNCSAIREVTGWEPARLECFVLRRAVLWIAKNLPKLDDPHSLRSELATFREKVATMGLEDPMTFLEVEPPPHAAIKPRKRQ